MSKFLLTIDVGNTNTTFGFFKDNSIFEKFRIQTRKMTVDELGIWLISAMQHFGIKIRKLEGIIVSSVVPYMDKTIKKVSQIYLECDPLFITAKDILKYMPITYPNIKQIGLDRLVNAVAIYGKYESKVIIIDFGTAITFCVICPKSGFVGGCIVPGFEISLNALYEKAAKLCPIDFKIPEKIIADNTADGIRAGSFFGYCALVDGIIKKMHDETGSDVRVIATGGSFDLLKSGVKSIDEDIPDLTLFGLNILFQNK